MEIAHQQWSSQGGKKSLKSGQKWGGGGVRCMNNDTHFLRLLIEVVVFSYLES